MIKIRWESSFVATYSETSDNVMAIGVHTHTHTHTYTHTHTTHTYTRTQTDRHTQREREKRTYRVIKNKSRTKTDLLLAVVRVCRNTVGVQLLFNFRVDVV